MSLVGNLEDLSLGDILQIISLSQKSGVLALESDQGSGRVLFTSGLVQGARVKGGSATLRDVLVGAGLLEESDFEAATARAIDQGVELTEALAAEDGLDPERIEALIKQAVEQAIFEMFSWTSGDFSFDVRSEPEPDDPELLLPIGVNAQYLAMEGLRLRDENARDASRAELAGDPDAVTARELDFVDPEPVEAVQPVEADELDPEKMFGDEPLETDDVSIRDLLASVPLDVDVVGDVGGDVDVELEPLDEALTGADVIAASSLGDAPEDDDDENEAIDDPAEIEVLGELAELDASEAPVSSDEVAAVEASNDSVEASEPERSEALELFPLLDEPEPLAADELPAASEPAEAQLDTGGPEPGASGPDEMAAKARKTPVVLIEPDVAVLEWVKSAIQGDFARVHVFQQAEQGLARIRQYLIRGELPLVLISPTAPIDPLSGIHGLADFIKRLKTQSPKLVALGLREDDDAAPAAMPSVLDGVLRRPTARSLRERSQEDDAAAAQVLSAALQEVLHHRAEGGWSSPEPDRAAPAETALLRDATSKLSEATSRGEILPLVLDFSAELFARSAVLIVRDDEAFAVAGRGIENLEVDPLDPKPPISLPTSDEGCLRSVLDSGEPLAARPTSEADRRLVGRFGDEVPERAYFGPIASAGVVVGLLYADQAASDADWPDTSGLDVVLQHAGMAFDRAALERARWEAEGEDR